jgi:hypothetical protein
MSEVVFELLCDSCGADYEITFVEGITNHEEPMYCPFCGAEVDLTDVEEEFESGDEEYFDDDLDFDDK